MYLVGGFLVQSRNSRIPTISCIDSIEFNQKHGPACAVLVRGPLTAPDSVVATGNAHHAAGISTPREKEEQGETGVSLTRQEYIQKYVEYSVAGDE